MVILLQATSSQSAQYAGIKDMDIDQQSYAWDQTKNHNNTDDENDKTETKKLKLQE